LVNSDSENSPSLLRALAGAWKSEKESRGNVECVLVTNRSSGAHWYQARPPLAEFLHKAKTRVTQAASLTDVSWDGEDQRYQRAWEIFIAELSELAQSDRLEFLQSLNVELNAPDLEALESRIRDRLGTLTGLPQSSVNGLFNALVANLRKWTCQTRREKEWIDREALRSLLANDEVVPSWLGHCEVETPEPFFPSRNAVVDELRASLLSDSAHKVDFLSAEPGAGKTSCISKLARASAILWKEQCVSVRFYAYRPVRPGQPDIGGDFGTGVRPEVLWLGLLWQIRDNLRKTHLLAELRVPIWLDGISWETDATMYFELLTRSAAGGGGRSSFVLMVLTTPLGHGGSTSRSFCTHYLRLMLYPDTSVSCSQANRQTPTRSIHSFSGMSITP
jgi:hypothetical protein